MKRAHVILNGGAGAGHDDATADGLREQFRQAGIEAQVVLAADGGAMASAARNALAASADMVVAAGGDGTINAVASVVAGSGVPFGVLPLGTLNHFAKDIGMPLELEAAVRTIAAGRIRRVDVGQVNDRVFLNNSSLGLYPDIVHDRDTQRRRLGRGKWLAALWASLAALARFPFLSVRLSVDGERLARRTPFVFIGNNEYTMSGLAIGERSRLDAGVLSLYVAQRPGRLGLLRFAARALLGRLGEARDFDVLSATEMEIETRHPQVRVATDGEVTLMQTPLRYRAWPGALTVIVPE